MRPQSQVEAVLYLVELGLNDCQIGRIVGVPRRTVMDWRQGKRKRVAWTGAGPCSGCDFLPSDPDAYSYLLGLYLGDGCISEHARSVFKLRIALDQKYPAIIAECSATMAAVRGPEAKIGRVHCVGCDEIYNLWKHWPCAFPQHGKGPKHLRPIVLEPWQQTIADDHPGRLLRGLIHSDGWRGMNRVKVRGRVYAYPRYQFSNESEDIPSIFCRACDRFGVSWRRMNRRTISVARRTDIALLDTVIGPKT